MENATNVDFGNSLDWLGSTEPVVADDAAPEVETAEVAELPAGETLKPAEDAATPVAESIADEPPLIPLVDDLGGEDGARQLIPLVRAIQTTDATPEVLGGKLHDALIKILTPDQFSALTWQQYDKYGELMAEQFLADNPRWAEEKGYVKADSEQEDYLLLPDDDEDLSPREQAMQARLAKMEAQFQQLQQKDSQTEAQKQQVTQQQIVAEAERAMMGGVVDSTFAKLEGWEEADMQKALRLAFAEFNQDAKAVEQYKLGVQYQQTKQPVLAASQRKASAAFAGYLAEAVEMVDAKRTKAIKATTPPIPPGRVEIDSTTKPGASGTVTQPASGEGKGPFDPNMLMKAVQERLLTRAASPR